MRQLRLILSILLLTLIFVIPISAASDQTESAPYQAKVLDVLILEPELDSTIVYDLETEQYLDPEPLVSEDWETQLVTVKILSGPEKGETITLTNTLTGHPYFDLRVKTGDRVVIKADLTGPDPEYFLADFSRRTPLLAITFLFIVFVVIIGGKQGIKAILSLFGMGIVILTMILPLILKGYNPILVTVGLSAILTGLFILFIGGFSKKTFASTAGVVGGLLVAGLLAFLIGKTSYLTGLSSEEAQTLQFMDSSIDFQGLLFSGMIIGALGAILDVGISIASSMEQIKEADPKTDFKTLFTRGILVGRDLIATMANTLILAYVGSSLPLLLLFQASDSNWGEVLNLDLVASEIVRAMIGSIGLTLAIPITALVSAFLFIQPEHKGQDPSH